MLLCAFRAGPFPCTPGLVKYYGAEHQARALGRDWRWLALSSGYKRGMCVVDTGSNITPWLEGTCFFSTGGRITAAGEYLIVIRTRDFQISVHRTAIRSNSVKVAGLILYPHLFVQLGGWSSKLAPE